MRTLVLAFVCLATVPATAQKQARARPAPPPAAQKMIFGEGDTVEADANLPQTEWVGARVGSKHESLIRIRTTFVPEMIRDSLNL